VAEHRPARSVSLQPHTHRNSQPGPEPSLEADVYVWRYALLVVHARKEVEAVCCVGLVTVDDVLAAGRMHRSRHVCAEGTTGSCHSGGLRARRCQGIAAIFCWRSVFT